MPASRFSLPSCCNDVVYIRTIQHRTTQSSPVQHKDIHRRIKTPVLIPHSGPRLILRTPILSPPLNPTAPKPPDVRPLTRLPQTPTPLIHAIKPHQPKYYSRGYVLSTPSISPFLPSHPISTPTIHPNHRKTQEAEGGGENERRRDALSLTKYPIAPITTNPIPTACEIFRNSRLSAVAQQITSLADSRLGCRGDVTWRGVVGRGRGWRWGGEGRTFGASVQEQSAFLQKVLGDVGQFLDLVGHGCWTREGRRCRVLCGVERAWLGRCGAGGSVVEATGGGGGLGCAGGCGGGVGCFEDRRIEEGVHALWWDPRLFFWVRCEGVDDIFMWFSNGPRES